MTRLRVASALVSAFTISVNAAEEIPVARFSDLTPGTDPPAEWKLSRFGNWPHLTHYSLVDDGGTVVLRAEAKGATAGLRKVIRIDPKRYPILVWRWKVSNLIAKSDIHTQSGDDFPARVFVGFDVNPATLPLSERVTLRFGRLLFGADIPPAALCYVWDGKTPVGTVLPNAFSDRVRMIVVRSGATDVGHWVNEARNVYEDYKRAFGSEPPMIDSITVATDTDGTGEYAEAFYGDITFRSDQPTTGRNSAR